ncbi:MAG: formate dehydrogenase subunit alpha [Planctomycetes bacterium]|nr:formate dehydrogenase subunit alpha [Planctomycetota bacterium]
MLTVDGRAVEGGGSLLEACRAAGARVPAFCQDDRVGPAGHCRSCLVEADGRFVAACTTPARPGSEVRTDTERLRSYRRDLGELLLSESTPRGPVAAEISAWGATGERYGRASGGGAKDRSHPYLRLDLDACILCRLCLRGCEEIQGQFVYAVDGRGHGARLTWGEGPFAQSECVSCGACASLCPTGAITDADRERAAVPDGTVRTTCSYCGVGCSLEIHRAGGEVARIEGAPSPVNRGHLCVKGRYAHVPARHPDRLRTPLLRRGGSLVPVSWEEAIAFVAGAFAERRGKLAGLSSSRCTNEENYLFQKWFRAGLGTHNVDSCARVCHAPSAAAMRRSFGAGAATNSIADVDIADAILVAGANPTESHPVLGARIRERAIRGASLLVIDPRRTELAAIADVHLCLRPGTNVPLLNSLACVLVEEGLVDWTFLSERGEGWEEYEPFVRRFPPEATESTTGVPAAAVRRAARLYGIASRPIQVHGLGVTEHYQGSEAVMLLCNLALLRGAVGREGVGVNPLRGQNNVQGAADMGCQPDLLPGYGDPGDPSVRARFERAWGRPLPSRAGITLPRMLEAARRGEIRGMFILGEDLVQTDPDSRRVVEALRALEILVVQELFLSETATLAHVVLPGASAFEKEGTFTNTERRVQRVRKAVEPPGEALADWEVLCRLMAATGYPQSYAHPAEVMEEIASVAPVFAGLSYGRLEGEGLQWPVPAGDHPGTPVLHRDRFARGRALLARVDYLPSPVLAAARGGLLLTTGRVLEHYNSGSLTRRTGNRDLVGGDRLEIHPEDAATRGIRDGDRVVVKSAFGEARASARLTDRVAPGTLFLSFHFPETGTNRLTSDVRDRLADCPEYKLTPVEVVRESRGSSRRRGSPLRGSP